MSILRCFLCWTMLVVVPVSSLGQTGAAQPASSPTGSGQSAPGQAGSGQAVSGQTGADQAASGQAASGQTGAAILHTQGGVWINDYEARDSSAVFPGDLLEIKPGFSANLNLEGSTVEIQSESVGKFQRDALVLDHGSVFVGTSTEFKVQVNCITVVPVRNEWTQYEVTDRNGTVQVAARKGDVRVEFGGNRDKAAKPEASNDASVREGEQGKYEESEVCGAPPRPAEGSSGLSPKWIGAGAAGAGVLIWILVHGGGGKTPISNSQP